MKEYEAVIFDLDGVIISTDEYHYQAWKALADELGVYFDRTINNRLRGVSRMESLDIVLERAKKEYTPAEKEAMAEKKNGIYKELLKNMSPKDLSDEVKDTLDTLRNRGYLLAIGSSSKNAPFILERIGLSGYFDAVSDGNNIQRSKPDPEVFVKAAEMLSKKNDKCLVVEDAVSGAKAAHAGGMKAACVGDASRAGAGDMNMDSFKELKNILV
ncbi:MAG: beta-phosphoglucomutase [Lachnospiraceae bacterium]|nr:beta-phosphoglucomutase [Lachnospiraceae bacterium]